MSVQRHAVLKFGIVFVVLLVGSGAVAQECLVMEDQLLADTSDNCMHTPEVERIFNPRAFAWKGHEYLMASDGNELVLWNADVPDAPVESARSSFAILPFGDMDYNLDGLSLCDSCRFGLAIHSTGLILFDLGAGVTPGFAAMEFFADEARDATGFTFEFGAHQYLVSSTLPSACAPGTSALFAMNGISSTGLDFVSCIDAASQDVARITSGDLLPEDDGSGILYLGDQSFRVHLFRISTLDTTVELEYLATPMYAFAHWQGRGLDVQAEAGLAVSTFVDGLTIWDVSEPASPLAVANIDMEMMHSVAIHYPFMWAARINHTNSSMTFDIGDPTNPRVLDSGFWDPAQSWNYPDSLCVSEQGADFSADGSVLYAARLAIGQIVDFSACSSTTLVFQDGFERVLSSHWIWP